MTDKRKMTTSEVFVAPVATTSFSVVAQIEHVLKIYMRAYAVGSLGQRRRLDSLGASLRILKEVFKGFSLPKGYTVRLEVVNIEQKSSVPIKAPLVVSDMLGLLFCRTEAQKDIELFSVDTLVREGKPQEYPHQINKEEIPDSIFMSGENIHKDKELLIEVTNLINNYTTAKKGFCIYSDPNIVSVVAATNKTVACINIIGSSLVFREQQ